MKQSNQQRKVLNRGQIIDRMIHNLNKREVKDTRNYLVSEGTIKV